MAAKGSRFNTSRLQNSHFIAIQPQSKVLKVDDQVIERFEKIMNRLCVGQCISK